jgi:hypothetical protein
MTPPAPAPLVELGAHDGHVRETSATALAGLGGEALAALLTPRLTGDVVLPLDPAEPVRLVIEEDGALVLAGRGQAASIEAAVLAAWPDAVVSRASAGTLWTSDLAVVALHGDEVYLVRGDAASTRARAALRLADDGGVAHREPAAPGLWLSVRTDAALVALGAPAGVAQQLGAQAERLELTLQLDEDAVVWRASTRAQPDTFLDEVLRGAQGSPARAAIAPAGIIGVAGRVRPTSAAALATTLAEAIGAPVGELPADRFTGEVALSPGGVALALDGGATADELRALSRTFGARLLPAPAPWVVIGAGPLVPVAQGLSFTPVIALPGADDVAAPDAPDLADSNDDVPASPVFTRASALAMDALAAALATAAALQRESAELVGYRVGALAGLGAAMRPAGDELVAEQRWQPTGGLAALRRELTSRAAHLATTRAAHDAALAALATAHHDALRVRAADVVAWDRTHAGATGGP